MEPYIIYKIKCTLPGYEKHIYIGSTRSGLQERATGHVNKHNVRSKWGKALQELGTAHFTMEPIETNCGKDSLKREYQWMMLYEQNGWTLWNSQNPRLFMPDEQMKQIYNESESLPDTDEDIEPEEDIEPVIDSKTCRKCNVEMPVTEFSIQKRKLDGKHVYQSYCKPCKSKQTLSYLCKKENPKRRGRKPEPTILDKKPGLKEQIITLLETKSLLAVSKQLKISYQLLHKLKKLGHFEPQPEPADEPDETEPTDTMANDLTDAMDDSPIPLTIAIPEVESREDNLS